MQFYTFDASRQTAHVGLANIQFHAELIDKRAPCTAIAHLCMYQNAVIRRSVHFLQGHFTNFGRIMRAAL
jgi:hypothetical protein